MTTETAQNKKIAPVPFVRPLKLSRGMRKHIRFEKARIRREASDPQEAKEGIRELYARILSRPKT